MSDIKKIKHIPNIFGDSIGFVENWDFSRANLSEENRILAITKVASICYQNPKALGSESLYNRLMAESMGLPSSSFEFVPILIPIRTLQLEGETDLYSLNTIKYGEFIQIEDMKYILTNYRAIVYDVESKKLNESWLEYYNNERECEIIKEHFKVFLFKVDFPTRSQMVRHRVSWQELSRRYVSAKRVPFDFYVSEKLKENEKVQELIKQSEDLYFELLENGVKPQEARRVIPQMAYTQIWGAFMPKQLENFYKLRLDEHSQWEIRMVAEAMKSSEDENLNLLELN